MFEKILVCLDGSHLAEQIIPYTVEQAKHFNSSLVLLQVFSLPSEIVETDTLAGPTRSPNLLKEDEEILANDARAYLESIAEPLRNEGLNVTCIVLEGVVGQTIVAYAINDKIDMIALATHGHSGFGRVVFGSVADYVLRESGLPILVIKPMDSDI